MKTNDKHNPRNGRKQTGRPRDDGYTGPKSKRTFVLPPGCKVLDTGPFAGLVRRIRGREGMGMNVLTDDTGRPVVRDIPGLRPGEFCFVLR